MITAISRLPTSPPAPAGDHARTPKRPSEPPLTPDSPMIALAYRCLSRDFDTLLARQPHPGSTPAPEDVHQIRIATRRMRVALRLFGALLPQRAAHLGKELRWFARALGSVRDLDVHDDALREHLQSAGVAAARDLGGYELALRRERLGAREALHRVFAGERYAALIEDLGALLEGAPSPAALRRWRSFTIRAGAARYLKKSRKRVVKLGRKLGPDTSADDLHRLRIRAKRLRYALEFFSEPYPELVPAAKATKSLQDVLGAHQDARTARRRLLAYARSLKKRDADAEPPQALVEWRRTQHREAELARRSLAAEWQHLVAALDRTDVLAR
ncbi:MAG TPA: CHAD domain-containing protein [Gammaproteobacteria bacterium]|nr:CHAD domain-containing protein [Gammaproteobacteria bacterium]